MNNEMPADILPTIDSPQIAGSFDGLEGPSAVGWARDEALGDHPVSVDVLADGELVASGLADNLRGDLLDAGIGKGAHGFRVALPRWLCDGEPHEISVRCTATGEPIDSRMHVFMQASEVESHVAGLDGPFVVGSLSDPSRAGESVAIDVLIDGQPAIHGSCFLANDASGSFSLRLPPEYLDRQLHLFTVYAKEPFHLIGEFAAVTPAILTPDDVLQRVDWAGSATLRNGAANRYESLRRHLDDFVADADREDPAELIARLRQVINAHEQVLRGFADGDHAVDFLDTPLVFPALANPRVSIVIPVHNKVRMTYNCLASLLLAPNKASFEVIVVDDGSSDDTLRLPEAVTGATFLRHEQAKGFVMSCNAGGQAARGEYIVMLNNDTEVTPGWIDELIHVFEHFDGVGMAGSKLLYPNGRLQEAGGIVWGDGEPWNYGRNGNPHHPSYNYTRQVDYISGACIMLPKPLWDDLGGFDTHFAPAYFEDTDLAFRVRDKGLKTVYAPMSQIVHFEGMSSGTSVTSGTKRFQVINKPKFKSRWSRAFRGNGVVGKDVDLNRDRQVQFRVLMLDYTTPQPDRDAGSYAALEEMRLLQGLGFKVTFVPENLAHMGKYTEDLQRMGVEVVFAPFILSVHEILEKRGKEFDVVYVTRYSVAQQHIEAIRKLAPQAKVILNNADLHFLRELRKAVAFKDKRILEQAVATRTDELALMRKVDLVLSYNETEHAVILSHNLDSTRVARCPWVVQLPQEVAPFAQRRDIAFLGGYSHHPNVEAVEFFIRDVMPLVRKQLPDARFRIYGSNVPEAWKKLDDEAVVVDGWVPDVADVYDTCRVFVAPLLTGAGIKGKVVGALAHGVPCVISPVAAEGTGIRDGLEAAIPSSPQAWADAIARLYNDEANWLAISDAARRFAASEFGYERGLALMQVAMEAAEIFPSQSHAGLVYKR